jgi:sodium-coupled neutral amino acid transporter 11
MFQLSTRRDQNGAADTEHAQPLLHSRDDEAIDRTIFSVEDADDEIEATALDSAKSDRTDHNVRFEDEVQVIGPSLRSTLANREAGVYVSYSLYSFLCSRLPFFLAVNLEFELDFALG